MSVGDDGRRMGDGFLGDENGRRLGDDLRKPSF
jgi:hypothetical protein